MTFVARVQRLAKALGVTLHPQPFVSLYRARDRSRWWLAAVEGDQPLPMTRDCATAPEALDAAEAWLAPKIDRMEVDDA